MNIYVHIPFCASKCRYCHFYSTTSLEMVDEYVTALLHEIDMVVSPKQRIDTLYFGGGTPSLLDARQITLLIAAISSKSIEKPKEITLEANPESLTKKKLDAYRRSGITRLSIGIQSWNREIMHMMNRYDARRKIAPLVDYSKQIGLVNINIDHIVAYPGQTDEIIVKDIEQTLLLTPTHVSVYPLEVHPHTPLHVMKKNHEISLPSKKHNVRQFSIFQNRLVAAGYHHYEEFSFAIPGYECLHNTDFWKGNDYLGLGVTAASRIKKQLITNEASIECYISCLNQGKVPPRLTSLMTNEQEHALNRELADRLL